MTSRFKRRLLLLFSFVFAGVIAYSIFYLSPKTGKLTPQEYFCSACLEGFILKANSLEFPPDTQFSDDSLFFYVPSQLDLAEKAMVLSVLQNLSQIAGSESKSEFASLGKELFEAWGHARLNIKIRLVEHGVYNPQKPEKKFVEWPRLNPWPFFYFSSLQTATMQNETMAFILLHPMQTEFDVFLSLAHQLFYLFDPADYSVIENKYLQKALRSFRALIVELQMFELYNKRFPKKYTSQYRTRNFAKLLKKVKKRDFAPVFEWVMEQLYPSDWTKEILTEDVQSRVFLSPRLPSQAIENNIALIPLGQLDLPYQPNSPVSIVGRMLPQFASWESPVKDTTFSEFFSLASGADGLLFELKPQDKYSADNNPALIAYSGIRKEIYEYMRQTLDENQSDDRSEVINSYIKGSVPQLLKFNLPLNKIVNTDLQEEF